MTQTKNIDSPGPDLPAHNGSLRYDSMIPAEDLKVGMFVTGIDREWLETPFVTQGFYIDSEEDISQVIEYCDHVWIQNEAPDFESEKVDFNSGKLIGRQPTQYKVTTSVIEEHKKVANFHQDAIRFTDQIMEDARFGRCLETRVVKSLVKECVDSVLRQPDALLWMTKMRDSDRYVSQHSLSVSILSIVFGRRLGLKSQQLENLGVCGLLHDVGKMRVPPEVLNKPGKLSEKEFKVMQAHASHGRKLLLSRRDAYLGAVDAAYNHHERPDGQGYPRGISGDSLSLFTKIISIVDAFDAITSDRVYDKARSPSQALAIIYEERGKQFDADLGLAFIQTIGIYPPGSIVEMANGMVGVVLEADKQYRHLPKVLIMLDQHKNPATKRVVNLGLIEKNVISREYLIRRTHPNGAFGIDLQTIHDEGVLTQNLRGM